MELSESISRSFFSCVMIKWNLADSVLLTLHVKLQSHSTSRDFVARSAASRPTKLWNLCGRTCGKSRCSPSR